jgi:hypothetical protein
MTTHCCWCGGRRQGMLEVYEHVCKCRCCGDPSDCNRPCETRAEFQRLTEPVSPDPKKTWEEQITPSDKRFLRELGIGAS